MAKGGRTSTTWKPTWRHGKTRTIRVPVAIADDVIELARALDEQNPTVQKLLEQLKHSFDTRDVSC